MTDSYPLTAEPEQRPEFGLEDALAYADELMARAKLRQEAAALTQFNMGLTGEKPSGAEYDYWCEEWRKAWCLKRWLLRRRR